MRPSFRNSVAVIALAATLIAGSAMAAHDAPLADAAEKNDRAAVQALLASHAELNQPQADGMTALHWAVRHDDTEFARQLVAVGADVKLATRYGITPLALACENGNAAIVELLLTHGADPNTASPGGETPLMTAARTGRVAAVEALIAAGVPVDATERKGQTALMWAAAEGNTEVVDALLNAGANYRIQLDSGFTPLFFAVREGRTACVKRLLAAGDDVNQVLHSKRSPKSSKATNALLMVVENGHFELAAALLDAGADPNAHPHGYSALHAITWVRKPIRGDGDPPPYGSGRLTALDFVRLLVKHKADINARLENGVSGRGLFTTTGSTPFELAAQTGDLPLLELLVKLGADPSIPNADRCPPLLAAAGVGALGAGDESAGTEEEAVETVDLLLKLGANINAVDDNGETAMHGAAYQSRDKLIQFLAEHGADARVWNQKNKLGWTPLMIGQGKRPDNFRFSPETVAAIESVLKGDHAE